MLSFHNDQSIKDRYLKRLQEHYDADEFIKGKYWEDGKGCAVGCTIHSSDHSLYEEELGIPEWLAKVEDGIFEGLPNIEAKKWPILFLQSIPVGVDLDKIKIQFLLFIVESVLDKFDHEKFPEVKKSIENVIHLLKSNNFTTADAAEAASTARDAADSADVADVAAYAADVSAYAAYANANYANYYYAAFCSANYAERKESYIKFSNKLIDLIVDLKCVEI